MMSVFEKNKPENELWAIRFYGVESGEFEDIAKNTSLPIMFNLNLLCICYEWFQYAKTDLGAFFSVLCNKHGYGKWTERRREARFPDGVIMRIGKIDNLKNCRFLQK